MRIEDCTSHAYSPYYEGDWMDEDPNALPEEPAWLQELSDAMTERDKEEERANPDAIR